MRSQNFHRHGAVKASIAGAVNFPHAASAQRHKNFIGTELRAGGKRH